MNMPWTNTTGLAKAVAIFASGLAISLGLCGLNFVAVLSSPHNLPDYLLIITAYIELAGIIVCAAGLIAIAIIMLLRGGYRELFGRSNFSKLNLQNSGSASPPIDTEIEKKDK